MLCHKIVASYFKAEYPVVSFHTGPWVPYRAALRENVLDCVHCDQLEHDVVPVTELQCAVE